MLMSSSETMPTRTQTLQQARSRREQGALAMPTTTSAPVASPMMPEMRPARNAPRTNEVIVRVRIQGTGSQEAHFVATVPQGMIPVVEVRIVPFE